MAGKGTKNNQQNTQDEAQSEQVKQTQPLDFDVRIQSIKPSDAIKGTASTTVFKCKRFEIDFLLY